jgi:hypothetical protein
VWIRLAELGSGTMLQVRQLGLATLYVMFVTYNECDRLCVGQAK